MNGDGFPDLLVATTLYQGFPRQPGLCERDPQHRQRPRDFPDRVQHPTTNLDPSSIALADLTNAGGLDMVVANAFGSVPVFMHGATPGTFASPVDVPTGGTPNQVVIGDVNGDGLPDLVLADLLAASSCCCRTRRTRASSSPRLTCRTATSASSRRRSPTSTATARWTSWPPVPTASATAGVVPLLPGRRDAGSFLTPVTIPAGAGPQSVKVADMDGDCRMDLVVADYGMPTTAAAAYRSCCRTRRSGHVPDGGDLPDSGWLDRRGGRSTHHPGRERRGRRKPGPRAALAASRCCCTTRRTPGAARRPAATLASASRWESRSGTLTVTASWTSPWPMLRVRRVLIQSPTQPGTFAAEQVGQ